jgi:hypothetical protein
MAVLLAEFAIGANPFVTIDLLLVRKTDLESWNYGPIEKLPQGATTWEEYRGGGHFASAYFSRMQFFQRVTLPQKLDPKHLQLDIPVMNLHQSYPTYTHLIPNK